MVPVVVESSLGTNKNVLKGVVGDTILYTMATEEFTPKNTAGSEGAILIAAGFSTIYKGLTLSTSVVGSRFKGVASEADALNDGGVTISASEFLRSNANDTTTGTLGIVNDSGLTLGVDSDLQIYVVGTTIKLKNNTNLGTFEIEDNTTITGDLTVTGTLTSANSVSTAVSTLIVEDNLMVLNSTSSGLLPAGLVNYAGIQVNRGEGSTATEMPLLWAWDESFADDGTTTHGNAGGAFTAFRRTEGNTEGPSGTASLIDIRANVVHAVSTSAQYADVAERFEADAPMAEGAVVTVGGHAEITEVTSDLSENVFGVISKQPAYAMNAGAGNNDSHPFVAMTGRSPVRVTGEVTKGQRLVSSSIKGTARAVATGESISPFHVIGRALESKTDDGVGLVNCAVRTNN